MGEVVDASALFRDRRKAAVETVPNMSGDFPTKDHVHVHLREVHGYGGPKSQTRTELERLHRMRHEDPPHLQMGKPHTHL